MRCSPASYIYSTVKFRFNVKSSFKVENVVTEMEFHIKKSRFKESNCADQGLSLNGDFTVHAREAQKVQTSLCAIGLAKGVK